MEMKLMRRVLVPCALVALALGTARTVLTRLPSDWTLFQPNGPVATTGTMPDGIALSPNGKQLAVIDGGVNPADVRILRVPDLATVATVPLKDAFGSPVWMNDATVLVPGASTDRIFAVDVASQRAMPIASFAGYPDALTIHGGSIEAVADRNDAHLLVPLPASPSSSADGVSSPEPCPSAGCDTRGAHRAAVAVSSINGHDEVYMADKALATVTTWQGGGRGESEIPVDLHPAALLMSRDKRRLFVACADADVVDAIDTKTDRVVQRIPVGLPQGSGASPNGLAEAPDGTLYVSLGAENAVAAIRNGKVIARAPAGWYPTGVAVDAANVYVANGKGEGSHANPEFNPAVRHGGGYVAAILTGSVRTIARAQFTAASTAQVLAAVPHPQATPSKTVLRAHGPIRHVIYIIKENRTYDQVLGDVAGANGDPKLAWFGETITPNQHAIVKRFGVFDNAYADAQVSANGHNWSTAAFANDYLERFWPANYGGRRDVYDFEDGAIGSRPANGYVWDAADRAHVSLRDYGEFVTYAVIGGGFVTTSMPGLKGKIDERFPPFDLNVSDEARIDEWKREFDTYEAHGNLPALEIVRLPNDHTSGTKEGLLTPQAFVAQNDHAFGRLVDIVSHSKDWASTAIFAIEDDAQNGPDHVDDQRTTFYLASPYARAGVHHAHYSTSSMMRTMELILGIPPMTIYDAVAPPMYDAFGTTADTRPFEALAPQTDVNAKNQKAAYGSAASARMDFTRADAADPRALNDILAHVAGKTR